MTAVTVVPRDYLVRWVGREAVVTLPEHFDLSNAGQIREELLSVIDRGAATLIADMTATLSRDHAGADAQAKHREGFGGSSGGRIGRQGSGGGGEPARGMHQFVPQRRQGQLVRDMAEYRSHQPVPAAADVPPDQRKMNVGRRDVAK